jgi:6-pyruvoyltetrahydropterin/6-carboxytetrahydropterin synthase
MFTLTKSFHFAAAHRLMHHEWVCHNVHGHNFVVTLTLCCEEITDTKTWFTYDHKLLKPFIQWVEEQYDHAFLTEQWDEIGEFLQNKGHKVVFFPFPPSTELLAQHLANDFDRIIQLPEWVFLQELHIQETPTAGASWRRG